METAGVADTKDYLWFCQHMALNNKPLGNVFDPQAWKIEYKKPMMIWELLSVMLPRFASNLPCGSWLSFGLVNGQREDALFSFVRALVMGQYGRTGYATPCGALL
jgi:hypothetical protein